MSSNPRSIQSNANVDGRIVRFVLTEMSKGGWQLDLSNVSGIPRERIMKALKFDGQCMMIDKVIPRRSELMIIELAPKWIFAVDTPKTLCGVVRDRLESIRLTPILIEKKGAPARSMSAASGFPG